MDIFAGLKRDYYGAILSDPPWHFRAWSARGSGRSAISHYDTMSFDELAALPIVELAARDCAAPRREHSRKPDETRERIEQLVAGPYLELFARDTRPGWDAWGIETGLFDNGPVRTRRQPSNLTTKRRNAP